MLTHLHASNPYHRPWTWVVVCLIVLQIQVSSLSAATVVGVEQGSSGKYDLGGATDFVMNFTLEITGTVDLNQFYFGISSQNNAQDLTLTLRSTAPGFTDVVTILSHTGVPNGNSTANTLITLNSTATLSSGSYSLIFSAPTASFNDWHVEKTTALSFNEGFVASPLNTGTASPSVTVNSYNDGDPGVIGAVPEPKIYVLLTASALLAFGKVRGRYLALT